MGYKNYNFVVKIGFEVFVGGEGFEGMGFFGIISLRNWGFVRRLGFEGIRFCKGIKVLGDRLLGLLGCEGKGLC